MKFSEQRPNTTAATLAEGLFVVRLLSRYILKEIFLFFSISLVTFTGLLLTIRMLRLTSLIVNRGVDFSQIATVFVAIIPTFLEIALPMAALLGVMLAIARLCGDSEVIVIKASGIGLRSVLKPIIGFALSMGAVSILVSCILRPWGFSTLSSALFDVARSRSTSGLSEGVFNKLGSITLYAERIDYQTGKLERILVDDKRDSQARKVVVAKRGQIVTNTQAQTISLILIDGAAHELLDEKYSRTKFSTNTLRIDPEELHNTTTKGINARELSIPELKKMIREYKTALTNRSTEEDILVLGEKLSLKQLSKKFRRAKVELGQRISLPFASVIMTFIGFAIGIMSPRTQRAWGAGFSVCLGLGVFIVYYGIFSIGLALADSGKINVGLALWLPNIVTSCVASLLVYNIVNERWQSVPDGIFGFLSHTTTRLKERYRSRS